MPHSCVLKWAQSRSPKPLKRPLTSPQHPRKPRRFTCRASLLHRVQAGTTCRPRLSRHTAPTLTSNTLSITSSRVNRTSWPARRPVRWRITRAAPITRCSFMAAPVWVKRTCCTRLAMASWRVSRMPKSCICTPSASFRTWLKPCKTTRSKSLNATTVPLMRC